MARKKVDTAAERQQFIEMYEGGVSAKAIVEKFDMNPTSIPRTARRLGLDVRKGAPRRRWSGAALQEMASLWQAGESQAAIAIRFGTTQVSVSRALRSAGVESFGGKRSFPRGEWHGSWKGGRVAINDGKYVGVYVEPDDPMAVMRHSTGYVPEHRLVMARSLGRPLASHESVHHINGDHHDNRLENLQLRQGRHGKGVVMRCRCCGSTDIESVEITDNAED